MHLSFSRGGAREKTSAGVEQKGKNPNIILKHPIQFALAEAIEHATPAGPEERSRLAPLAARVPGTEAGMFAIRSERDYVVEEDFMKAARRSVWDGSLSDIDLGQRKEVHGMALRDR